MYWIDKFYLDGRARWILDRHQGNSVLTFPEQIGDDSLNPMPRTAIAVDTSICCCCRIIDRLAFIITMARTKITNQSIYAARAIEHKKEVEAAAAAAAAPAPKQAKEKTNSKKRSGSTSAAASKKKKKSTSTAPQKAAPTTKNQVACAPSVSAFFIN